MDEVGLGELGERGVDGEAADKLGEEAVADEVLHLDGDRALLLAVGGAFALHVGDLRRARRHVGAEADPRLGRAPRHELRQPGEGAAADEEDVGGVDRDEVGARRLAAAALGHVDDGALEHLEERLLDALARDVARHRDRVGLPRELVDLVDVHDAHLRG